MNKLPIAAGLALSFGAITGPVTYAEAAPNGEQTRMCVDATGGVVDPSDPINVAGIQQAVGAYVDGNFGPSTCKKVWNTLIEDGHLAGDGAKLKIGDKVHEWLGVSKPTDTSTAKPPTTQACPSEVKSAGEITPVCMGEAKARLANMGFKDDSITRAVMAFQIEAGVIPKWGSGYGTIGPKTYSAIMNGSGIQTINQNAELGYGIVIDLSDQTIKAYIDGRLVIGGLISSGKAGSESRTGTKNIYRKRTDADGWVLSSLQDESADPAMYKPFYIDNGQAIHGTRKTDKLGAPASAGCTRTAPALQDALIATGLMTNGTTVTVQA